MAGIRLKFKIRGGIRIKLPPGKERYHPRLLLPLDWTKTASDAGNC